MDTPGMFTVMLSGNPGPSGKSRFNPPPSPSPESKLVLFLSSSSPLLPNIFGRLMPNPSNRPAKGLPMPPLPSSKLLGSLDQED